MNTASAPRQLKFKRFTLAGTSVAGVGTCLTIPEWSVSLDVAQGFAFAVPMRHLLITHGHMDHAAGIPYLISQRALHELPPPKVYMPEVMVEPLTTIMRTWEQIEGFQYHLDFVGLKPGKRVDLQSGLYFCAFPTRHRIPAQGYTLFSEKKKLKQVYQNEDGQRLAELRQRGVEIEEWVSTPELSFTGDTQIEFLDLAPEVKKSRILVMEMTYVDESRPIERARAWGHLHLQELLPRLRELECEKIVLVHLSRRHRHHQVEALLQQVLTPLDRERVILF